MHPITFTFLLPYLALYAANPVIATPSSIASPADFSVRNPSHPDLAGRVGVRDTNPLLYLRDGDEHGHGHGHHANMAPLVELNETEVLLHHDPTPPSYWSIDIDEPDPAKSRHPGLMTLHALFMMLAFLGALPAGSSRHTSLIASVRSDPFATGIALRSVNHAWYGFSMIFFWTCVVLSCGASGLYRKLTPNM